MENNKKEYKPFSSPRWNQQLGAEPTGETFELTEEDKKNLEQQDKKWEKTVKKLKEMRNNTK